MLFEIEVFTSHEVGNEAAQDIFLIPVNVAAQRSFNHVFQWGNKVQARIAGRIDTAGPGEREIVVLLKPHVALPPEELDEFLAKLNEIGDASYTILVQKS